MALPQLPAHALNKLEQRGIILIYNKTKRAIHSGGSFGFRNVPADFTKQDAVKQAEVLGIGDKTIDRWLQKSINRHEIQHVAHGIYSKIKDEIA